MTEDRADFQMPEAAGQKGLEIQFGKLSLITLKAPPMFALMAPPEPTFFTLQTG